MLTRTQKNQIWDIIPTTFDVEGTDPSDNSAVTVQFLKDGDTSDNHVQVIESFAPDIVRYPTIQIQYASAGVRANFMNFKLGNEKDYATFGATPVNDGYHNTTSPIFFDFIPDTFDGLAGFDIFARMPTSTVTSWLRIEVYKEYVNSGSYNRILNKLVYPEAFGAAGNTYEVRFSSEYDVDGSYRVKLSSLSVGIDATGIEVATEGGVLNLQHYKFEHSEVHGNVEDLTVSIRIASDHKIPEQEPGTDYFVNSQDIVDSITKDVQLAFFRDFDGNIDNSELVTSSRVMDITPTISSGKGEQVVAKQVDFIIANRNALKTEYVTAVDMDLEITEDNGSLTI